MWPSPNKALRSVVFPDPTGPTTTVSVKGRICKFTPRKTGSASTDGAIDASANSTNGCNAPTSFSGGDEPPSRNSMPDSEASTSHGGCAPSGLAWSFAPGHGVKRRNSWIREKHATKPASCGNPTSRLVMGAETRLVSVSVAKVSAASRPLEALVQNRPPAMTRTGVFVVKNCAAPNVSNMGVAENRCSSFL